MSPLFSVRFTADLAPTVMLELKRMSGFLEKRKAAGMPVEIQSVYRAFTVRDICSLAITSEFYITARHLTVRRNLSVPTWALA